MFLIHAFLNKSLNRLRLLVRVCCCESELGSSVTVCLHMYRNSRLRSFVLPYDGAEQRVLLEHLQQLEPRRQVGVMRDPKGGVVNDREGSDHSQ